MSSYTDHQPDSTQIEEDVDLRYELVGGPLNGATICLAADMTRDQSLVRIIIDGTQYAYVGTAFGESLDFIEDPTPYGHAWRPVRWIARDGETYIFSDDRPVMPVEVVR